MRQRTTMKPRKTNAWVCSILLFLFVLILDALASAILYRFVKTRTTLSHKPHTNKQNSTWQTGGWLIERYDCVLYNGLTFVGKTFFHCVSSGISLVDHFPLRLLLEYLLSVFLWILYLAPPEMEYFILSTNRKIFCHFFLVRNCCWWPKRFVCIFLSVICVLYDIIHIL